MTKNINCRVCGKPQPLDILSLGKVPLANSLLKAEDIKKNENKYPLNLVFCPVCSLVQIDETIDPEVLFKEYLYFSSYSETIINHAKNLVNNLISKKKLSESSFVIEIASNDGYLLQFFKEQGIPILGIEPAQNIAEVATEKGIPTLCKFFSLKTATALKNENKLVDVIIGNNVLAHVANLNDFVKGIRAILKEDGIGVFEFPYVKEMIEKNEFDTIYHEHLCYYSLTSVNNLFLRHNLAVIDVEKTSIHGGSIRITVTSENNIDQRTPEVEEVLKQESSLGLNKMEYYLNFAEKVKKIGQDLTELLIKLKNQKKSIVAYGAAAKGTILMNVFDIGKDKIDFIVDRNPHKQGRFMPGNHIPIYSTEKIMQAKPDYLLILAWNFAEEIISQQLSYKNIGGKFIIPIPELKVV